MLLYPQNIENKLGFDKIRTLIEEACCSDNGIALLRRMTVLNDFQVIDQLLRSTDEQKNQLVSGDSFPELNVYQLNQELDKSAVKGYYLSGEQLFKLKLNLDLARGCKNYFKKKTEDYPIWASRARGMEVPEHLLNRLGRVFEKNGEIRDNASPELKRIRNEIRQKQQKTRKELESILKQAGEKGYTDKDNALTIRDGRLVIPLHAEHKRHIKGLIVDESTTGKTVYMEPIQVFNQNNEVRELQFAEKREVIAILTDLTGQVAINKDCLLSIEEFLGELDFTRAKAKVAVKLDACRPKFNDSNNFSLVQARHPVLLLANQKQKIPVVPLDLSIDQDQRIIVVSGPNAGGKSVCLKTVGLLQMMLQSGILVPVEEHSTMGCFSELFIDIGDEQSIESDLSTYSSHLSNMKYFLDHCSEHSLLLIDEFGTGTEPQFGGAIAESILKVLVAKMSRGLVTTHYGNLKEFADTTPGVTNGAMRFDLHRLEPLYVLELGKPGSSFALQIAAKIGLPEDVLEDAKASIGHDPVAFETLVNELEQEKRKYQEYNQRNQLLNKALEQEQAIYQSRSSKLEDRQKEILNQAKMEAQQLLTEANKRIEATIRSIKENKAQKAETQKARKQLEVFKDENKPKKVNKPVPTAIVPGPIKPGDMVRFKDSQAQGEVISITGGSAEILMGALKSKVRLERLQKIGKAAPNSKPGRSKIEIHQKREQFSTQLDVRGLRAAEALAKVDDFIDQGLLFGMSELQILHGKGDGILREVIRRHLREDQSVRSMQDAHVERGGAGITLVTLK